MIPTPAYARYMSTNHPAARSAASATPVTSITLADVPALAAGCAVFGTGGGGAVQTPQLGVEIALEQYGPVPVKQVADLDEHDVVVAMSGIGAPSVGFEMLAATGQAEIIVEEIQRLTGKRITTIMATEIGGSNGVGPVGWAASLGLSILDADGMGRAFPEAPMTAMNVANLPPGYAVLSDVIGNVSILRPVSLSWLERHARALTVASGAISIGANYVMDRDTVRGAVIEGSVSRAVQVGRRLLTATDPVEALTDELGAALITGGKVVDIERRTEGGFTRGSVTVEGIGEHRGRLTRVEIQNENLVVMEDGAVIVSVPDLVTIVDSETGDAISTEMLRFGQRVSVLAWACDPLWRTPRGLELAGPRAFGYDLDYEPFGTTSAAETLGATR